MSPPKTARRSPATARRTGPPGTAERIFGNREASLLDVVDNVLNKGVVLTGDVTLALAQVDLIYARLSLLLCAADRVLPAVAAPEPRPPSASPGGGVRRERT